MDIIQHMSGGGIPAEKYPIKTFASEMLARAMWFLKVEMYSVKEGEYELFFLLFSIHWVDSQEMAFPVMSLDREHRDRLPPLCGELLKLLDQILDISPTVSVGAFATGVQLLDCPSKVHPVQWVSGDLI